MKSINSALCFTIHLFLYSPLTLHKADAQTQTNVGGSPVAAPDHTTVEEIAFLEHLNSLPQAAYSSLSKDEIIKLFQIALTHPQPRSSLRMRAIGFLGLAPYVERLDAIVYKVLPTITDEKQFDDAIHILFALATPQGVSGMRFEPGLLGNPKKYDQADERDSVIQTWKQWIGTRKTSSKISPEQNN